MATCTKLLYIIYTFLPVRAMADVCILASAFKTEPGGNILVEIIHKFLKNPWYNFHNVLIFFLTNRQRQKYNLRQLH